jgi:hypothetical protein
MGAGLATHMIESHSKRCERFAVYRLTRGDDVDAPTTDPGGMLVNRVPVFVAVALVPRPFGNDSAAVLLPLLLLLSRV